MPELTATQLDELRHHQRVQDAVERAYYDWTTYKSTLPTEVVRLAGPKRRRDPRGSKRGIKRGSYKKHLEPVKCRWCGRRFTGRHQCKVRMEKTMPAHQPAGDKSV